MPAKTGVSKPVRACRRHYGVQTEIASPFATFGIFSRHRLRDVRIDPEIIRLPRWIGTEAARLIDTILKGSGGSWNEEINGYQFPTAAASVLQQLLEGTPRPAGNRLATFETPEALAYRMRELATVTELDHVHHAGMRFDLAQRAGIAIPVPSSAEVAAGLDYLEVAETGLVEPSTGEQTREAAADNHNVDLVRQRFTHKAPLDVRV